MNQTIRDYLTIFGNNPHLQALVVVVASLLLAKITDIIVGRMLFSLTRRTKTDLDDEILKLLHRPLFSTVALLGLIVALEIELPEQWDAFAYPIIICLIVLVWMAFALRLSKLILYRMSRDEISFSLIQPATLPLFDIGFKLIFIALGSYSILLAWNINISAWLASAGIFGLAIGLAAQETLSNLFAGVSILADAPYKIGDYIILDNAERGEVTKIGLRSSRILTRDQVEIIVPNSAIANSTIVNESGGPSLQRRLKVPIGVAYGSDAKEIEELLLEVAARQEGVVTSPAPNVRFVSFGASSLDFELRCWIPEPSLRGAVLSRLNHAIYDALNQAGVEIPFPQQDIHLKQVPTSLLEALHGMLNQPFDNTPGRDN